MISMCASLGGDDQKLVFRGRLDRARNRAACGSSDRKASHGSDCLRFRDGVGERADWHTAPVRQLVITLSGTWTSRRRRRRSLPAPSRRHPALPRIRLERGRSWKTDRRRAHGAGRIMSSLRVAPWFPFRAGPLPHVMTSTSAHLTGHGEIHDWRSRRQVAGCRPRRRQDRWAPRWRCA